MTSTIKQELEAIDKQVLTGHYHEAMETLEKLLEREGITKEEEIIANIFKLGLCFGLVFFINYIGNI